MQAAQYFQIACTWFNVAVKLYETFQLRCPVIRRDYDIFEKFPDGSTLWRACVRGRFEAQRKMDELAERSDNRFYMIGIEEPVLSQPVLAPMKSKPSVRSAVAG